MGALRKIAYIFLSLFLAGFLLGSFAVNLPIPFFLIGLFVFIILFWILRKSGQVSDMKKDIKRLRELHEEEARTEDGR